MSAEAYDAIQGRALPKHGHVIYGSDYGTSPIAYPFAVTSDGTLSVQIVGGGSSGGTQYVESTALGSTPTGTLGMARVVGTLGSISQSDNQAASMRVSSRGALWVAIDGTMTVSGTVAATQSGSWILSANSGVDIGDVTINNASGASAVNIQDGGNSITVDGTVAATQSGTWNIATVTTVTTVSTVTSLTQFNGVAIALNTGVRAAGVLRVTIATDDIVPASQSGTWNIATVTTVTTVSTVTSLTQFNGVAIALNTGVRAAGVLRVTIATDDIVPASQSGTWNIATVTTVTTVATVTSLTQMNGAAIAMNTGVRAAGVQRVTICTDDIVPVSQSGTWNIGTVTTVTTVSTVTTVTTVSTVTSLTQMNGAAIAMNTGVRAAGVQRVTICTDDIVPVSQSGTWNIATVTTVTTVSTVTSLTQMNGAAIAMNTGVRAAGVQRVTICTDDIVPVSQSGTWNIGTVTTVTTVSTVTSLTQFNGVAIALNTGVRAAGVLRVTIATDDIVPASQSGTWNIATVTTVTTVSTVTSLTQFNGVAIALNTGVRSTGTLRVTIATDDIVPCSQSGTWNIGTVTTVTTVSTVTSLSQFNGVAIALNTGTRSTGTLRVTVATDDVVQVVGNIAHDGVDSGNPVGVAYRAIAHGTNPTAVSAADRTVGYANRAGVPFVIGGHPNPVTIEAAYTSAQTNAAIVTVAAGLKIVVTRISFLCDNANTVNVAVRVGFATATTPTTTGVVLTHPGVAPGSGVVEGNGGGMLGVGADDEDLRITCGAPTTGSCRVLVTYYTIES